MTVGSAPGGPARRRVDVVDIVRPRAPRLRRLQIDLQRPQPRVLQASIARSARATWRRAMRDAENASGTRGCGCLLAVSRT
jgi:hypothetical protein